MSSIRIIEQRLRAGENSTGKNYFTEKRPHIVYDKDYSFGSDEIISSLLQLFLTSFMILSTSLSLVFFFCKVGINSITLLIHSTKLKNTYVLDTGDTIDKI